MDAAESVASFLLLFFFFFFFFFSNQKIKHFIFFNYYV
jgi:hypothetical protein